MEIVLVVNSKREVKPYFPPHIPPRLCYGKSYPYSRMGEIVDLIRDEGRLHIFRTTKITKDMLEDIPANTIYMLTNSNEFFYVRGENEEYSTIYRIKNISTSQPWTIEYDAKTGERVRYFNKDDNYKIVDEVLNYAVKA